MKQISLSDLTFQEEHFKSAETEIDGCTAYVHYNCLTDKYNISIIIPNAADVLETRLLSIKEVEDILRDTIDFARKFKKKEI